MQMRKPEDLHEMIVTPTGNWKVTAGKVRLIRTESPYDHDRNDVL